MKLVMILPIMIIILSIYIYMIFDISIKEYYFPKNYYESYMFYKLSMFPANLKENDYIL
jgi:hypothetical protein